MHFKRLFSLAIFLGTLSLTALAAEKFPMKQGLHEWPALHGKLYLVVGTYQDSIKYSRTYNFFFKNASDEDWNQVPVTSKKSGPHFTWQSAVVGEVTLADGLIVERVDGVYFIVGDKEMKESVYDKGTITATWYKLSGYREGQPEDLAYQFKPVFTRSYPNSKQSVEDILAREAGLQPKKSKQDASK